MRRCSREQLQSFLHSAFQAFPWTVELTDWAGDTCLVGQGQPHWYGEPLRIHLHTEESGADILHLNAYRLVERFLSGEVDFSGNFHLLTEIKQYLPIRLTVWQFLKSWFRHRYFQDIQRARENVRSHYDIPQEILDRYLDVRYRAYSCAMFEDQSLSRAHLPDLIRPGEGLPDTFDSLEKAQWRKFHDAIQFVSPQAQDRVLDVGCGYGGQLEVALAHSPVRRVVGWTHSVNQVAVGTTMLQPYPSRRWELNEGDYRQDTRVYDHVLSTGMISHVGPGGLVPYVRHIRKRIKTGGRYVHHALMANWSPLPLDAQVGIAFNKKYVWPGFHWFTLGDHIRALERNGFRIEGVRNLRQQYAKTLTAWYERMMQHTNFFREKMGEPTFRAWQLYLGGGAGLASGDVNRIYCRAI